MGTTLNNDAAVERPQGGAPRTLRAVLAASICAAGLVAFGGCFDFDAAYDRCVTSGMCGDLPADAGGPGEDAGADAGLDAGPNEDAGSDGGVDAGPTCPPGDLCDAGYYSFHYAVNGLWASGPDDIWADGVGYNRYHWVGSKWIEDNQDVGTFVGYSAVWGSGPDDVWFVGSSYEDHWNGGFLENFYSPAPADSSFISRVFGTAQNDVWFVGDDQTILHWNGAALEVNHYDAGSSDLYGVWVGDGGAGWIVGQSGAAFTRDGGEWLPVSIPGNPTLANVFGFESGAAFAVGNAVYALDGGAWKVQSIPTGGVQLYALHGLAPNDVYAAGESGTIIHFDGSKWTSVTNPVSTANGINTLFVTTPTDVWVGGYTQGAPGFVQHLVRSAP